MTLTSIYVYLSKGREVPLFWCRVTSEESDEDPQKDGESFLKEKGAMGEFPPKENITPATHTFLQKIMIGKGTAYEDLTYQGKFLTYATQQEYQEFVKANPPPPPCNCHNWFAHCDLHCGSCGYLATQKKKSNLQPKLNETMQKIEVQPSKVYNGDFDSDLPEYKIVKSFFAKEDHVVSNKWGFPSTTQQKGKYVNSFYAKELSDQVYWYKADPKQSIIQKFSSKTKISSKAKMHNNLEKGIIMATPTLDFNSLYPSPTLPTLTYELLYPYLMYKTPSNFGKPYVPAIEKYGVFPLKGKIYKKKSKQLLITEGESAKASLSDFGVPYISYKLSPKKTDYGIFPLKGKLLLTAKHNELNTAEQNEINAIKKMVGLEYSPYISFDVEIPDSFEMIPNVEVEKDTEILTFYSWKDYEAWKKNQPDHESWTHKHYKGLGISNEFSKSDFSPGKFFFPIIPHCLI